MLIGKFYIYAYDYYLIKNPNALILCFIKVLLSQFLKSPQVLFVCYEELCKDQLVYRSILDFIDNNLFHEFDFKLSLKEINLEYDSDLYDKCLESYNKLKIQIWIYLPIPPIPPSPRIVGVYMYMPIHFLEPQILSKKPNF